MSDANNTNQALEEIDKLIAQEDPGFNASLENIKKEAIENTTEIEMLDVDFDSHTSDANEKQIQSKKTVFKKLISFLLWPFIKLKSWLALRLIAMVNRAKLFARQSWFFIKNDLPQILRYLLSQIKSIFAWLKGQIKAFFALSMAQKLALVGSIALACGAVFLLSRSFTGDWLPVWKNPLIRGFHEKASFVTEVDPKSGYSEFFLMFPEVEFHLQLGRIVVNLKPSPGIPNPMGAFEFYLGLDSNETAIEIKDREKEVLDLTQRTLEDFTYLEVMSPNTQKRVWARIRDNINEILNQGRVQKVYVKTMLTYRQ